MNNRYDVRRTYPRRGPMQQYRLSASTAFTCFRCGREKKSKLVTVFEGDWSQLLCNACYGLLLSLHEIRAGDTNTSQKVEELSNQLMGLVSADQQRQAERLLRLRDSRSEHLDGRSLRLLATSDFVATHLAHGTNLDWSAAVIGLCKAVEVETVGRLIEPLRDASAGEDLCADLQDADLGRVARYCDGRGAPPELGVVRHFLVTAANSRSRWEHSALLRAFRNLVKEWPNADWLLDGHGAPVSLGVLATQFRNRAAHTDELTAADYEGCRQLVAGDRGVLWYLISATARR